MNNRTTQATDTLDSPEYPEVITSYDYSQARKEALALIRKAFPPAQASAQDRRARLWSDIHGDDLSQSSDSELDFED